MESSVHDTHQAHVKDGRPNLASAEVIVNSLRHPVDVRDRIRAINAFVKRLRRADYFNAIWASAGGAAGLATLMSDFSVLEVHRLCRLLGRTASAANARKERRDGLGELVIILTRGEKDPRPLGDLYQFIIPACHESVIRFWDASDTAWTRKQQERMLLGHPQFCEQKFLDEVFSRETDSCKAIQHFAQHQPLFRGNTKFSKAVLKKLESSKTDEVSIPRGFIMSFVVPLLKRLAISGSSGSKNELHACLDLVVRCCQKHSQHLGERLSPFHPDNLLQLVTQLWIDDTSTDRGLIKEHLICLYKTKGPISYMTPDKLYDIMQKPQRHDEMSRYEHLCILLRYLLADGIDLEDESPASLRKLGSPDLNLHMWPAELFLSLPSDKSLALFLRLKQRHQGQSFIKSSERQIDSSILQQVQSPKSRAGDLDIVETVLRSRAHPNDQSWLDTARSTIRNRIKAATESREAAERGFWIKSAVNLCVAALELELLAECLRLARRFTRDPTSSARPWGSEFLGTKEFLQLLTVVPDYINEATSKADLDNLAAIARRDMSLAHEVMLTLLRTALSAVGGPGFREDKWVQVIQLPVLIARRRSERVRIVQKRVKDLSGPAEAVELKVDKVLAETVWKPTIQQLLEIESLLTAPAAPKPWSSPWQAPDGPLEVLMCNLPIREPSLLAEMTRYGLETVRSSLPHTLARARMSTIAEMTTRLSKSRKPTLALPFVRTIIQEGDYSVDHRQLLTNRLLSSLPADTARAFLETMVDGVTDLMKKQNTQTMQGLAQEAGSGDMKTQTESDKHGVEKGEVTSAAIKVSTIKMMAQLLNRTTAISPSVSCEMLVTLLKEARHIDARVEIIRSLLGTLETQTARPALRAMILDVLEEHVLPMASQLNERRETTELEWHREDGSMPEVSRTNAVFDVLLLGLKRKKLRPDDHAKLGELVFRALEQSAQHNKRWISIFLGRRLGCNGSVVQSVPLSPARIDELVSTFVDQFQRMPHGLFSMLQENILANVCPRADLLDITRQVKADSSLAASNARQHWLKQYDSLGLAAFSLGVNQALRLLSDIPANEIESDKAHQLRHLLVAVAERCIRGDDPDTVHLLMDEIADMPSTSNHARATWNIKGSYIMREVVSIVEQAHISSPDSTQLPDLFRLRLAMLKLATWDSDLQSSSVSVSKSRDIAAQISGLVEFLVLRPLWPYHTDFGLLKSQLVKNAQGLPGFPHIALALGRLHDSHLMGEGSRRGEGRSTQGPLASYLCLELVAEILLASSSPIETAVSDSVRALLRDWSESEDVVVRKTGVRVEQSLRQRQGWYT